eukprot:TRINITY_DN5557_c0_g1_i8.p2 TRINITY_DN5557_c0_g1~~TRINITY_DN5557_c0_g1_i8.p2  ORF type:complete len:119 (+),score=32.44 TRINITY_DN5557_c0_g1_i8:622-978(+)
MVDAIQLWKSLQNSTYFDNTPFVLLLNKKDLFKKKLKKIPLERFFEDFKPRDGGTSGGGDDDHLLDSGLEYFKEKFCANAKYTPYVFPTCALDTQNCLHVFDSVREIVRNRSSSGLEF